MPCSSTKFEGIMLKIQKMNINITRH